jgi:hypothetical protein
MPFEWLEEFQHNIQKTENYAEKTLAAYRLGMRAGGAVRGVRVQVGKDCCQAASALPSGEVYHPDQAPLLPLPECERGLECRCVYRPVMTYEAGEE